MASALLGAMVTPATAALDVYTISPDAAALSAIANESLYDHDGRAVLEDENKLAFHAKCQDALKESIWRERSGQVWPRFLADPLDGVHLGQRVRSSDPRILYFVGASRPTAAIMVSRLLLALYHPSHLFMVHVDLKANDKVMRDLQQLTTSHPNIHIMRSRRLVQWGAWTMVLTFLDALHSAIARGLDFDFVINLSDVDVALRTNEEIVDFLRPHKGRQFVQVHQGTGEWLEKARNFTNGHVVVECGGYGYVAINSSVINLGGNQPQCCFGRGGPVLYANTSALHLHEARDALRADHEASLRANASAADGGGLESSSTASDTAVLSSDAEHGDADGGGVVSGSSNRGSSSSGSSNPGSSNPGNSSSGGGVSGVRDNGTATTHLHTGSQWVILDRAFATYLVRDERAAAWIRVFEHRFLSDESFVQTVLMHSPYASTLVNHNLRYIYWPHFDGDPTSYWARMGYSYIGGPQVINSTGIPAVLRSPYMFARKVDPTVDARAVSLWDEWMAKKLKGARPDDQAVLGGRSREEHGDELSLERRPILAGGGSAGGSGGGGGGDGASELWTPQLVVKRPRRVDRIVFEDGSACDCSAQCEMAGTCCDDWPELCQQGRRLGGEGGEGGAGGDEWMDADEESVPTCPPPSHPPLESERRNGSRIRLTFLNHARHPVKLFHLPASGGREVEMGELRANGPPLTFTARDSHAWAARSWGGATMLELPPREGRRSSTIDIFECEPRGPVHRAGNLHDGWK